MSTKKSKSQITDKNHTTKLIIEHTEGDSHGFVTYNSVLVGYCIGLNFGEKKSLGRPALDNSKRVAGYLAYWYGRDTGMTDMQAREFAISSTNYGFSIERESKIRSFKKRLEHEKTIMLVAGKARVTIRDSGDSNLNGVMLLDSGFRHFDDSGQLKIEGTGWVWKPSQECARYGKFSYVSPPDFTYLNK
jgi:hypothetical protein